MAARRKLITGRLNSISRMGSPRGGSPMAAHDAAKAFIGDVSGPLKALLPNYRRIERDVKHAIFARFGISLPLPKAIKEADIAVLAAEQAQIMPAGTNAWALGASVRPAAIRADCLPPAEAKALFLERYRFLSEMRVAPALVAFA